MTFARVVIGYFLLLGLYQSIAYSDLKINYRIASIKNRLLFMMSRMEGLYLHWLYWLFHLTKFIERVHPSVVIFTYYKYIYEIYILSICTAYTIHTSLTIWIVCFTWYEVYFTITRGRIYLFSILDLPREYVPKIHCKKNTSKLDLDKRFIPEHVYYKFVLGKCFQITKW